ncbi:unnamed protein product [Blepharisma stoltei]|uniref:HTH CENPB-type domain-containing protein n=1 Tax=Blepharisma stoltei TaxID=1481888 RepID=A0AAU9KAC3_9CILI|nr:unnamed protein product [Blepharisma stoltei]
MSKKPFLIKVLMELKRKFTTNSAKIEIVDYYFSHKDQGVTMREVAEKFHLNSHASLVDWIKNIDKLRESEPAAKRVKVEPFTQFPILEKELIHWLIAVRQQGHTVLRVTIEKKARELARELSLPRFQCGQGWWEGFKTRNNLAYRKVNASSLKPLEREAELVRDYLDELMNLLDIYPSSIFTISMKPDSTGMSVAYDFKGAQKVVGIQSAKAKHSITVMLLIRADGKKFPALLIFQEKTGKIPFRVYEHLTIPNNIVV